MDMYGYVYETRNLVNGKLYIGLHAGKFERSYFGSGVLLRKALKKYGTKNFSVRVIEYCKTIEDLNTLEKKLIAEYREKYGMSSIYNIHEGGSDGVRNFGLSGSHHSISTRMKISRANKGQVITEAQRRSSRLCQIGVPVPEERRKKISVAHLGKPKSEETKKRMSASAYKRSPERIEAMIVGRQNTKIRKIWANWILGGK